MASLGLSFRLGFVRLGKLSRGEWAVEMGSFVSCLIGFFLLDSGMAVMGLYFLMNRKVGWVNISFLCSIIIV